MKFHVKLQINNTTQIPGNVGTANAGTNVLSCYKIVFGAGDPTNVIAIKLFWGRGDPAVAIAPSLW